jgi:hypothetical protein
MIPEQAALLRRAYTIACVQPDCWLPMGLTILPSRADNSPKSRYFGDSTHLSKSLSMNCLSMYSTP